uniref:Uncharacterized protein n=1 Tax=Scleropages formosus TaxID=113540 RepID=A0A8C9VVB7_SCLFO
MIMGKNSQLQRALTALLVLALALASPEGSVRAGRSSSRGLLRTGGWTPEGHGSSGDGELDGAGGTIERSEGHQALQGFLAGTCLRSSIRPSVRCDDDTMSLRLRGRRDSGVLVDRGEWGLVSSRSGLCLCLLLPSGARSLLSCLAVGGPPVPLSQLPPHCGFSLRRSRRDLLLVAPYDGCHVSREDGRYVLPLRVHGAPVKMSCPATLRSPATVSCGDSEMVVRVEGASAHEVRVKVGGSWESLLSICGWCASSVDVHRGHLLVTIPYTSACLESEEASLSLRLLTTSEETTLSCPRPSDDEDEDDAGPTPPARPAYPMFPPYYPMSFYPLYYPTVAPTAPRPSYPRYPFNPMGFPYMYPQAPRSVAGKAASQGVMYPGYPLFPMPYVYRYPTVPHH